MTGKKKYCTAVLLTLLLGIGIAPVVSFAADPAEIVDPDLDMETPAFANPAQARHAAKLAEQAAASDDSIQDALQDVQDAQDALDDALNSNDPDVISAIREALAKAESAYADALADVTGVSSSDIAAMRDSGMGWGVIAHELGVQPGLLGLGHTRGKQNHFGEMATEPDMHSIDQQELDEATVRNMESGWSRGHGVAIQAGVHEPGTGLFVGRSMASQGKGFDGDHDRGDFSGAGGLGHGGNSDGSMGGGSDSAGGHGASSGQGGGTAGSSAGPGNSGGQSAAGTDGSPGNSGSSSGHGSSGDSGSSGGMGGMGGGHGSADGSGW